MLTTDQAQQLIENGQVLDHEGNKIGKVGQIYLDDTTSDPAWVTVKTGLFGNAESFAPLADAELSGDDVRILYSKDKVKDAPKLEDADGHLSPEEEADLYRHYGVTAPDSGRSADRSSDQAADVSRGSAGDGDGKVDGKVDGAAAPAGRDTSGPDTDSAMTRSEEQLRVGTETETVGRARLRKYVVTENVTKTVPVSHEEVRIEREPITAANRGDATTGGDITEEEHEVELKGERVVTQKEAVPVERVQMGTETVTEDQQVREQVRKEQIEADTGTDSVDRTDPAARR